MNDYYQEQVPVQDEYVYTNLKDRIVNPSTIVSLLASLFLFLGIILPIIDFTAFHENVDIQYNLLKVCKNVGIISPIWNGIPYGIIFGIVLLVILSFVNIPPLKLIPVVLIIVMYIIMLFDAGNVIEWVNDLIEKFIGKDVIIIDKNSIIDGIMQGAYFTGAGIVLAILSCFLKGGRITK